MRNDVVGESISLTMYTVGRLGSYISRGVYTVSGPFHPFGGAVDIIVVQQPDGSFKSSPWYVRFGKFQGVLKAKEKVVSISVDGVQADFHMCLDSRGEAYFVREVDVEGGGGDSVLSPSSSGEETDGQSGVDKRPTKSKSSNFDANRSGLVTQIDISNGKILKRTSSRRSRIRSLVFGRKSMKQDTSKEEDDRSAVVRADSLERAEIAADLLEVNWSTNLASSRYKRVITSQTSAPDRLGCEEDNVVDSPLNDNKVNSLHSPESDEGESSPNSSWDALPKLEISNDGVEMLCLSTKHVIGTSSLGESGLQENCDLNSHTVTEVYELCLANSDHDENSKGFISDTTRPNADSDELDVDPINNLDEEQVLKEESEDRLEALSYSETVGVGNSSGKIDGTACVSCKEGVKVCVHAEILQDIAEMISEVESVQDTSLLVANERLNSPEILVDGNCGNLFVEAQIRGSEGTCSDSSEYAQMVIVKDINSFKEVEPCSIHTCCGFDNSISEVQDGQKTREMPAPDSHECRGDSFPVGLLWSSEGSEEEQLLFGDFDDFNQGEIKCMGSGPSNQVENENPSSKYSEAALKSVSHANDSHSSSDKYIPENMPNNIEDFRDKAMVVSSCINIPSNKVAGMRMAKSLPNIWSLTNDMVVHDFHHPLGHSLDDMVVDESSKFTPLGEDFSSCVKSDAEKEARPIVEDTQILQDLENVPANLAVGNQPKGIDATDGSWRVWPFGLKKSRSMKVTQPAHSSTGTSDADDICKSSTGTDREKDELKPMVKRKIVSVLTPTPEQLASLNLKEGKNIVTFTFSTSMLGPQQVDARIYLWKWDTRVVISDVDGTITKSEVLGQFMPMVGMDWSHTGVAHLFSAIKENGYQLLFLSARAISQAYHTRQFLFNLKQDGKALPDGPVVISPDGLFPSLFREVIRRAPHEFKIACLEDIKALFPSDCNPFYAGFGNRDTDEVSYLKVGIPKGKIFIINPKGEVVVNRWVDSKSYTSLHVLVHGMFPPMSSS